MLSKIIFVRDILYAAQINLNIAMAADDVHVELELKSYRVSFLSRWQAEAEEIMVEISRSPSCDPCP